MKALAFTFWSAAILTALNGPLHSENTPAKTPLEALQQMKAQNTALLEKQTATNVKLEELAKEAQQLKFLGKRS